jgi:hypothetical protein
MRAHTTEDNVFTTTNNRVRRRKGLQFISQGECAVQQLGELSLLRTFIE